MRRGQDHDRFTSNKWNQFSIMTGTFQWSRSVEATNFGRPAWHAFRLSFRLLSESVFCWGLHGDYGFIPHCRNWNVRQTMVGFIVGSDYFNLWPEEKLNGNSFRECAPWIWNILVWRCHRKNEVNCGIFWVLQWCNCAVVQTSIGNVATRIFSSFKSIVPEWRFAQ